MLPYVLALVIGLGSFAYYMAAFFFPEVHRKSDFVWSGVGFFYALVLWVCAGRITGAVLLSQIASVSLLGWLGWETLTLRRQLALPEAQTEISPQVQQKIVGSGIFQLAKSLVVQPVARRFQKPPVTPTPVATPEPATEPATPETEIATAETEIGESFPETVTEITEEIKPPEVSDVPVSSSTEGTEEAVTEPVMADITESAEVTETDETTSTEQVQESVVETTPPEAIEEIAPEESLSETPAAEPTITEPTVAETPVEEPTVTETPTTENPIEPTNPPKQRGGISGFFNNLLGKSKEKPAKPQEPQTVSEDIPPSPEPERPESSQPDTSLQESPTPSQDMEETAVAEEPLTVDTSPVTDTSPPEPELPQNQDSQPPETPEEFADSEQLIRPTPPQPEPVDEVNPSPESESLETPDADITPEAPLSPSAEPMDEGDSKTQQPQNSENPPQ
ncbi:Ycf66 family protein [Coleofasciculus chthonoplastes]|uniref:Ycf66 family protein n=1 Tax=Coleofasciculus chthonoplastes TaxID=64178 RepID=UPI00069341BF|nr:Ycf66 family protein [Coleofasciculus chthonoplastes]